MFIGRERELEDLRLELSKWNKRSAVLVYGKRRVGKSTLLRQATLGFEGEVIYHVCVSGTFEGNLELLFKSVCEALNLPMIRFESLGGMIEFLGRLGRKILLIIDEYPYLKQSKKQLEVDSYMQALIDTLPLNVKLILCGSYIATMKELLKEGNPLFGRFTLIQHIREFDYYDAAKFYPNLNTMDKVAFYAVFGGCPFVLENLDSESSLEQNITRLFLRKTGIVRSHVENVMLAEIKKAYDTRILAALGNGKKRYSEITDIIKSGENGLLDKQLRVLIDMETIVKTEPINRRDEKKRFYEIVDNLMRFYFTFIFGSAGTITRIGEEQYFRMNIEGERLRQFVSRRFEAQTLQYFRRASGTGEYELAEDFGCYWYDDPVAKTSGEFDCVVKRHGGEYDFYECKYFNRKMTLDECKKEEAQVRNIKGVSASKLGFVSTGGFENDCYGKYVLIDGEKLYSETLQAIG